MAASTTSKPDRKRLYDVMHELYCVDADGGIPDQATLEQIETALHGVIEFMVDPMLYAVLKVVGHPAASSATFDTAHAR
jgi:hypothetical protein